MLVGGLILGIGITCTLMVVGLSTGSVVLRSSTDHSRYARKIAYAAVAYTFILAFLTFVNVIFAGLADSSGISSFYRILLSWGLLFYMKLLI